MSNRKYLRGFANLGYIILLANSGNAYTGESTYHAIPGAMSCSPSNRKNDFDIYADDGIWDGGAEWNGSELVITIAETELEAIAVLTGATYSNGMLEEGALDEAPEVALTFSALRADNGYRLFRYYVCKCTDYKVTHTTKGQNRDAQTYELTFKPESVKFKLQNMADRLINTDILAII